MHSLIFLAYLDQCSMWGIVITLHLSSASVCFSHVKVFPRINGANETKLGRNVTLVRQLTITYGQLMSSLLIFKYNMSHGTMKYTLQAHVYYYVFMAWLLHYLYSLHGCVPFKIVSYSPSLHSRWLLLLKIEISSIVHCWFSIN